MFSIRVSEGVASDLAPLRIFDRAAILDAIERHLCREPDRPTRRRKRLDGLLPPWDAVPPIWELRVGEFRVFYDVDRDQMRVHVRAIRRKPPHLTTEQIL